jgi:hypothetical protein
MEFQIQVKHLGTAQQKAQVSLRMPGIMKHFEAEIAEWSTSGPIGSNEVRSVQGRISELGEFINQELKELNRAEKDIAKLRALEAAGVDNWEGYGNAMASLEDEDRD